MRRVLSKRERVARVQQAMRARADTMAELSCNTRAHRLWFFPCTLFQSWAPFLFLLLTCLRADGVCYCVCVFVCV